MHFSNPESRRAWINVFVMVQTAHMTSLRGSQRTLLSIMQVNTHTQMQSFRNK